ncbi:MAG: glycosyltransferase N-terminal domain-containing protein [bacterium]
MLMLLYRIATGGIGAIAGPYGRVRAARGDRLWQGRLGLVADLRPTDVWVHASSVGEVRVAANLVRFLAAGRPDLKIHLTTMTVAGQQTACAMLGAMATTSFFPWDFPSAIRRTLDTLRPRLIVIAETEIWPNLLTEAAERDLPVVLVNGRMSRRAFGRYRLFGHTLGQLLATYDRFFFKTNEDAERYASFGIEAERVEVAGDMKFDAPLPVRSPVEIAAIRAELGVSPNDFLLVAGSTREGEEVSLLQAYQHLRKLHPHLKMVMAPRHVERCPKIRQMLKTAGVSYAVYGDGVADIILVDRVGILNKLYLAADLAFVGGTLVEIGGHNLLEPVWAGTPVVYGPSLGNVAEAAAYIENHNYGARVADKDQLIAIIAKTITGEIRFRIKNEIDLKGSATTVVGEYILSKLDDA